MYITTVLVKSWCKVQVVPWWIVHVWDPCETFLSFSLVCRCKVLLCPFLGTWTGFSEDNSCFCHSFWFSVDNSCFCHSFCFIANVSATFLLHVALRLVSAWCNSHFFISFSIAFNHQLLKSLEYFVTYASLSLDAHSLFCFSRNGETSLFLFTCA